MSNEETNPAIETLAPEIVKTLAPKPVSTAWAIIVAVLWVFMLFYGPFNVYIVNKKHCLSNAVIIFLVSFFMPFIGVFLLPLAIFFPKLFCKK